jgi:RHS repeat-associated protein
MATLVVYVGTMIPAERAWAVLPSAVSYPTSGMPSVLSGGAAVGTSSQSASVDLSTGEARASFTFQLEAARGEAQPALSLSYSSNNGVGYAGWGWTLPITSIVRKGASGMPQFLDLPIDAYPAPKNEGSQKLTVDEYYADGKLLVPIGVVSGASVNFGSWVFQRMASGMVDPMPTSLPISGFSGLNGWVYYRTEIDDGIRYFLSPNGQTWLLQTKSGRVLELGVPLDGAGAAGIEVADASTLSQLQSSLPLQTFSSQLKTSLSVPSTVYRWSLVRDTDINGNTVQYQWSNHAVTGEIPPNGRIYLTDIYDTPGFGGYAHHVRLNWKQAPSAILRQLPSPIWKAQPQAILSGVDVTSANQISGYRGSVRRYYLNYTSNALGTVDLLSNIVLEGECVTETGPLGNTPVLTPALEDSSGSLGTTNCPLYALGWPVAKYTYSPDVGDNRASQTPFSPVVTSTYSFEAPVLGSNDLSPLVYLLPFGLGGELLSPDVYQAAIGCGPWSPSPPPAGPAEYGGGCGGGFTLLDFNGDGAADFVYGPIPTFLGKGFTWNPPTQQEEFFVDERLPARAPAEEGCAICGAGAVGDDAYSVISNPNQLPNLKATLESLSPGGNVVYGDWSSTGVLDWLWLNIGAGAPGSTTNNNSYQTWVGGQDANVNLGGFQVEPPSGGNVSNAGQYEVYAPSSVALDGGGVLSGSGTYGTLTGLVAEGQGALPTFANGIPQFSADRAVDLDGDGLPDMLSIGMCNSSDGWSNWTCGVQPSQPGLTASYLTVRDRDGSTWPFDLQVPGLVSGGLATLIKGVGGATDPSGAIAYFWADMNGDGLADVVAPQMPATSGPVTLITLGNRGNGLLGSSTNQPSTIGQGSQNFKGGSVPNVSAPQPGTNSWNPPVAGDLFAFGDLNGDGLADYVVADDTFGLQICLREQNEGLVDSDFACTTMSKAQLGWGVPADENNSNILSGSTSLVPTKDIIPFSVAIADMDGSGIPQVLVWGGLNYSSGSKIGGANSNIVLGGTPANVVWMTAVSAIARPQAGTWGAIARPNLLTGISDNSLSTTTIAYESANQDLRLGQGVVHSTTPTAALGGTGTSTPPATIPVPVWVVSKVTSNNGLAGTKAGVVPVTSYTYTSPVYDPRDREFVGFQQVQENHQSPAGLAQGYPEPIRNTYFATEACSGPGSCYPYEDYSQYRLTRGLPVAVEDQATSTTADCASPSGVPISNCAAVRTQLIQYQWTQLFAGVDGRTVWQNVPGIRTTYTWNPQNPTQGTAQASFPNPLIYSFGGEGAPPSQWGTAQPPAAIASGAVPLPTDAAWTMQVLTYDLYGNQTTEIDSGLGSAAVELDQGWQLPDGDQTGWNYRLADRYLHYHLLSVDRLCTPNNCYGYDSPMPGDRWTHYAYDALGRPTSVSSPTTAGSLLSLGEIPAGLTNTEPLVGPAGEAFQAARVAGDQSPPSSDGELFLVGGPTTAITYDTFGNVTLLPGPDGRCVGIAYDWQFNQIPVSQFAYAGGCPSGGQAIAVSGALETDVVQFDREFGAPTLVQGPYVAGSGVPGIPSQRYLDSFGRLTQVYQADPAHPGQIDQTKPTTMITYGDRGLRDRTTYVYDGVPGSGGNYEVSWSFFDGFGANIMNATDIYSGDGIQSGGAPGNSGQYYLISGLLTRTSLGQTLTALTPFLYTATSEPQLAGLAQNQVIPQGQTVNAASYTYDGAGRVLTVTDPVGNTWKKQYSASMDNNCALVVTTQDPEQLRSGGTHSGAYSQTYLDFLGRTALRLLQTTQGGPEMISYSYLASGEQVTATDGNVNGQNQSLTRWARYDTLGRLVFNAEPNTSSAAGSMVPNDLLQDFGTYGDAAFLYSPVVGTAEPDGVLGFTYAYDDSGDLVGVSDARGCGESIYYNTLGQRIAEDYSPCAFNNGEGSSTYTVPVLLGGGSGNVGDGTEAYYTYDNNGRLSTISDLAQQSTLSYDGRNRLMSISRLLALGGATTSSGALATRYVTDQPFTKVYETSAYNTYTAKNLPIRVGTGSNVAQLGGSTNANASFAGSFESYTYNSMGKVQSVGSSFGPLISSVTYDQYGSPLKTTYGDVANTTATLGYDADERISTYSLGRGSYPWGVNYASQAPTVSGSLNSPNTLGVMNSPNTLESLLTSLGPISYDGVSNPTAITDGTPNPVASLGNIWPSGSAPISRQLGYDDFYRLISVANTFTTGGSSDGGSSDPFVAPFGPAADANDYTPLHSTDANGLELNRSAGQNYLYDARGNLQLSSDDQMVVPDRSLGWLSYGSADQLANSNGFTVSYDAAGNITALWFPTSAGMSSYEYTWDELGRLSEAKRFDFAVLQVDETYSYDASGQRVLLRHVNENAGTTTYTANVFDSLVLKNASLNGNGTLEDDATTEQLYLSGGLGHVFYDSTGSLPTVATNSIGNPRTHLFLSINDRVGSTAFVIDHDTSELVERDSYLAYGGVDSEFRPARWQGSGATLTNEGDREDYRFGGHWDQPGVGLVYMGARYYSPFLGRFISPDPLVVHGGAASNPYEFASSSPFRFGDPTGLGADDSSGSSSSSSGSDWTTQADGTIVFSDDNIVGSRSAAACLNGSCSSQWPPPEDNGLPGNGGGGQTLDVEATVLGGVETSPPASAPDEGSVGSDPYQAMADRFTGGPQALAWQIPFAIAMSGGGGKGSANPRIGEAAPSEPGCLTNEPGLVLSHSLADPIRRDENGGLELDTLSSYARRVPTYSPDGVYNSVLHSNEEGPALSGLKDNDYNDYPISPEEWARIVKSQEDYNGGPVCILGCKAGYWAQDAANALGQPVQASKAKVVLTPDGTYSLDRPNLPMQWYYPSWWH